MKGIRIQLKLDKPISVPPSYNQILQGIIYNLLAESEEYSTFLHDNGFSYEKRSFKLFTFSRLQGRNSFKNGRLLFYENVKFEIRTADDVFVAILVTALQNAAGVWFGENWCSLTDLEVYQKEYWQPEVRIKMLTPIIALRTVNNQGKYFSPLEPEFNELVSSNFQRKFCSAYGEMPEGTIEIAAKSVAAKDKEVIYYKGTQMTGWYGEYYLKGDAEYICFLYYTGIGAKNPQGFGMFEVL